MSLLDSIKRQGLRLRIAIEPDGQERIVPAHVLVVEETGAGLWKAVEARVGPDGVTILAAYRWDADRGPDAHDMARWGSRQDRTVLFLPDSRQSVCRLLDMPDVPQPQLEQMVALRLEVELPYPPHESTWACRRLPADGGTPARVALIAQATRGIESAESVLASWGIGGASLVFAPGALVDLAADSEAPGDAVGVALVERNRAIVAFGRAGALCYARHIRLEPERAGGNGASEQWLRGLARELKQCLFDYAMRTGGPLPGSVRVAGILTEDDRGALAAALELPVARLGLPENLVADDPEGLDGDVVEDYALAAGALLGLYRQRVGHPSAAPPLRAALHGRALRLKRSMAALLAVNAALLVGLAASIFLVQKARLASAERFVRESKTVLRDMESLQEEVDILRYEEGQRVSVLEILMALSEVLPQELKVQTLNLDAKGNLIISGTTKSVEAVSDGVTEALNASPMFKNPQFKGATQGQDGFGFTLTCELASAAGAGK